MRPSILSTRRFDLVIMPRHDRPPKRKNIIVTEGALNLIDEEYIKSGVNGLESSVKIKKHLVLGLLLGGDTKNFKLTVDLLNPIIPKIKLFLEKHDAEILITTSRRTNRGVEHLIKQEFSNYSRCKLLIIANENNSPFAVGGILGLSQIVIVSPESISMISEAASSGRYIVVFKFRVNRRNNHFLNYMSERKYIYLCKAAGLSQVLEKLWNERPHINILRDKVIIEEALKRII
jgi:mitochondrial fission protein ELM1